MISSWRPRLWLVLAGVSGAASVAFKAYAYHGLDRTSDVHAIELLGIATSAQGLHALALIAVLILADRVDARLPRTLILAAGWAFAAGLVLFCAGLEALALGVPPSMVPLVPTGGTALILGWLALAGAGLAGRAGWRIASKHEMPAKPLQATAATGIATGAVARESSRGAARGAAAQQPPIRP